MSNKETYETSKSPMQNLLDNTLSEADKVAIYEFARKHGISQDESLWNQMLLQLGLIDKHVKILKEIEKSNKTIVEEIDLAIESAIKRLLDTAYTVTGDSLEQVKSEAEKQVENIQTVASKFARDSLVQLREAGKSSLKELLQEGVDKSLKELNHSISEFRNQTTSLQNVEKLIREEVKISLGEIAIYVGVGSFVGLTAFILLGKFVSHWF